MADKIKIAPCLWFDKNAEEAAAFYERTFPDSRVIAVHKSPVDYPSGKAGDTLTVEFTVLGQRFLGLNGGPQFHFDEAVSFQVYTDTQEETDRYWNAIVGGGGQESMCGWCKDKFGLSWQITPRALPLIKDGRLVRSNLRKEWITVEELQGKLRESGIDDVAQVRVAYLESSGELGVIRVDRSPSQKKKRRVEGAG